MDYLGTDNDDIISQAALGLKDWVAIYGYGGNDTLTLGVANGVGGPGNDKLIGTSIWSTAVYWGSPKGVIVDLQVGQAQDGYGTVDTLVNIRSVHGTVHADTLLGSSGVDTLYGGAGDDFIDGGTGWDTVQFFFSLSSKFSIRFDEAAQAVIVSNADASDSNHGTKTLKNIEAAWVQDQAARAHGIAGAQHGA